MSQEETIAANTGSFKMPQTFGWFKNLIPGIIIAALVFGPSKMTIASKIGAEYGYSLLWLVVVAMFFMVIFTNMASRIGAVNNGSLLSLIQRKWGKATTVAVGLGVFFVTASFQAGNSIGVGISLGESTGTSPRLWIVVFNIIGISLLFFRSFYKTLEKIMLCLVGLMLLAFTVTLCWIKPGVGDVLSGFVPSVPKGSVGLVIAFMASCFSIVGAFYQSYLVQERIKLTQGVQTVGTGKSLTGMVILGVMSLIVMICAATILHPQGIKVNTALDMAKAMEPLFGKYAAVMFLAGMFGASFSCLIGNATVGGTLLSDAFGYGYQLSSKMVRVFIALVMIVGAVVSIIFGKLPLNLIVMAQTVTIFLVPFIGYTMYAIANDREIMGDLRNSKFARIAGAIGLIVLLALACSSIYDLFIK